MALTLLQPPADPRTRSAMVRLFYEQSLVSLAAAALLIALHLAYAWPDVPATQLVPWAAAFVALLVLRLHWRRQVRRLPEERLQVEARAWERRAEGGSLATGVLWAVAIATVFDADRSVVHMYVGMLACITGVGSINVMAPLPRAFVALIVPLGGTLVALFLSMGRWSGAYEALLAAAGTAMALALVARHARLLRESHALRFEREQLLAQTQAARDAQARFLAAASHDLRQPVHALGLLAAHAREQMQGRAAEATARQMEQMAQALDGLVETVLDISRLDSGAVTPRPAPWPLQRLFDRLAPEFAVLADARGLQWRLRPTAAWVLSDEMQLERMLRNLLSNALRFTTQGGVLLAAQRRGGSWRIGVWDTGAGIAPQDQARVFDEFVQLDNPGRDRRHGHGLGLAIVRRLSRLLEHPLVLRSRPGRGSLFAVQVPAAPPGAAAAAAPEPQRALLPGLALALVEDDEAVRAATEALLSGWGCRVHGAADAAALLARWPPGDGAPHALVCDWRLGDSDGLEAIAQMRRHFGAPLPALLITGEAPDIDTAWLRERQVVLARKPLQASQLRAWLGAVAASGSA